MCPFREAEALQYGESDLLNKFKKATPHKLCEVLPFYFILIPDIYFIYKPEVLLAIEISNSYKSYGLRNNAVFMG